MNKYEQHPLYKRFPPMKNESFAATLPPRAAYLDLSCATLDLLPQTLRLPPYTPSLLSSSLPSLPSSLPSTRVISRLCHEFAKTLPPETRVPSSPSAEQILEKDT